MGDYIVSDISFHYVCFGLILYGQEKGWEPDALHNWLAVTGWGTSVDSKKAHKEGAAPAPDSTAIFTLQELIQEVTLSVLPLKRLLTFVVRHKISDSPSDDS